MFCLSPCVCGMATWLGDKGKGWRESSELPAGSLAASWHLSTASCLWPEWKKSSRIFPTLPKNYSSFFLLANDTEVSRVGLTASRTFISPVSSVPCQLKTSHIVHPTAVHNFYHFYIKYIYSVISLFAAVSGCCWTVINLHNLYVLVVGHSVYSEDRGSECVWVSEWVIERVRGWGGGRSS